MTAQPELRLVVNPDTGESRPDDAYEALSLEHEELKRKYFGTLGENGKLRKSIAELRGLEPEAEAIRDILEYSKERFQKPRQEIVEGGERWEKCRARLRDKPDGRKQRTPEELKLAIDGALLDPWLNGSAPKAPKDGRYLDAKTVFRSPEKVEELRDLALGFQGKAGVNLGDILPLLDDMRDIDWKFLLRVCECGHRRMDHAKGAPQGCFRCGCEDWEMDVFDSFNIRHDPFLQRHYGQFVKRRAA